MYEFIQQHTDQPLDYRFSPNEEMIQFDETTAPKVVLELLKILELGGLYIQEKHDRLILTKPVHTVGQYLNQLAALGDDVQHAVFFCDCRILPHDTWTAITSQFISSYAPIFQGLDIEKHWNTDGYIRIVNVKIGVACEKDSQKIFQGFPCYSTRGLAIPFWRIGLKELVTGEIG